MKSRTLKPADAAPSAKTAPAIIARAASPLRLIFQALRPHQWSKNLLVFLPQLLAHAWGDADRWLASFMAFVCFCLCASAVYLVNDVLDLEADRSHPHKKHRPFASGLLPIGVAYRIAPTLVVVALALSGLWLPHAFVATLLLYVTVTTLYSTLLNRKPIVDILVLAGLYALRIFAGACAVQVAPSPWLLGFSLFFFLSLAFLKRYVELVNLKKSNELHRNRAGYTPDDLVMLLAGGLSCGYLSVLVFALYVQSPDILPLYRHPGALWAICPVLIYWVSRVWFIAHRGMMHYDPVVFALRDRVSLGLGLACIALVALGL